MSMHLIHTTDDVDNGLYASTNWAAIQTASGNEHGMVFIADKTVKSIGRLINDQVLTNSETVTAYYCDDDDGDSYGAMIRCFGPSLLPVQVQDQVRDLLAAGDNGKNAVSLFDKIIYLELQISLSGTDRCMARINGVNWSEDEIEINRCERTDSGNLYALMHELGLGDTMDTEAHSGEVSFDRFATAVNDNGRYTDMGDRLARFVECGRRQNATKVYWG